MALLFGLWLMPLETAAAPRFVYLTWQSDPATTITVNFHTFATNASSWVFYDTQARGGDQTAYRFKAEGTKHQVPGLADGRFIHWTQLENLEPATSYFFIAGDELNGFSAEFKFRTPPVDGRPLRFIAGGDMGVGVNAQRLLDQVGKREPLFVLLGGDLAYADGNLQAVDTWDQWLENWQRHMITPQGYMVPMVVAIGNHEVPGGYNKQPEQAPFYFGYFAQNGTQSYYTRRFGKNVVIFVLDSGHVAAHDGPQLEWLKTAMARSRQMPVRLASYHVPLYPGFRPFQGKYSQLGRVHWQPLFDQYRLQVAFEHHDHVLKRSKLLRENQVDPDGTLYLGDGCLGREPRVVKGLRLLDRSRRWYLAKVEGKGHFWQVEVEPKRLVFKAVDEMGEVFDEYVRSLDSPIP